MSARSEKLAEEHMWKNIPLFMLLGLMFYCIPESPLLIPLSILIIGFNVRLCIE
jgi:hypothetical protein